MAKAKLNQIIAIVTGRKTRAQKLLTESHRGWNKDAIAGIEKTYRPLDDNGDQLPAESKKIHLNVSENQRKGNFPRRTCRPELG